MSASVSQHRNISFASFNAFRDLLARGERLFVRGEEVREIRNRLTVLRKPLERCLFMPGRGNSVFAAIAETVWVVAGRNDVDWLKTYVPRAPDYSDDGGHTWRAGYGPRLRNWNGVDQLKEVRDLIRGESGTRRAAMGLFDPASDFIASKDIPCNNWLHWLVRDGNLHLNVAVRSNDAMWGFSGINAFEWSVLHQMMAYWCTTPVGDETFFASSFHLYKRHYEKAERVVKLFRGVSCYDYGLACPSFSTPLEELSGTLKKWFNMEAEFRANSASLLRIQDHIADPFLTAALELCRIHLMIASGCDEAKVVSMLQRMPSSDFAAAGWEYVMRKNPLLINEVPTDNVRMFLDRIGEKGNEQHKLQLEEILVYIKKLHKEKDAAYRTSWKRRGELISILANIARKVDRISEFQKSAAPVTDESVLDTAVDLFVYLNKYRLYLLEQLPNNARSLLSQQAPEPLSEHVSNFDLLTDQTVPAGEEVKLGDIPALLEIQFEEMNSYAQCNRPPLERLNLATRVAEISLRYVVELIQESGVPNDD